MTHFSLKNENFQQFLLLDAVPACCAPFPWCGSSGGAEVRVGWGFLIHKNQQQLPGAAFTHLLLSPSAQPCKARVSELMN